MQQCRELLAARDLWAQAEAAAPGAAAELKQLTGILAGIEARATSCPRVNPLPLPKPQRCRSFSPDSSCWSWP